MKIPKISKSIRKNYSPLISKEIKGIKKKKYSKISRKNVFGITIDKKSSSVYDDGIWGYRDGNNHVIEVSISDVAELVKRNSALDWEALNRVNSVYYKSKLYRLFPESLSIELLSLNHQSKRFALTVRIILNDDFDVLDVDIFESIFYNKHRLDYEKFYEILDDKTAELSENLSYFLYLAQNLSSKRLHSDFLEDDRKIFIGSDSYRLDSKFTTPSFLVAEFTSIANRMVAKWMIERNIIAPFRNHLFKNEQVGFENTTSQSFYSPYVKGHQAFGFDYYTHFTSPIWRFADIIVHRQIKAFLNPKFYSAYSFFDVLNICTYINTKVHIYKNIRTELILSYKNAEQNIISSLQNLESENNQNMLLQNF